MHDSGYRIQDPRSKISVFDAGGLSSLSSFILYPASYIPQLPAEDSAGVQTNLA
jgi:hypothetical protein